MLMVKYAVKLEFNYTFKDLNLKITIVKQISSDY